MIRKKIYIIIGCIFFALGLLGYYMPVMPGTIFMIIAAYFFMHSSDRLYKRIVNNPYYGGPIKNYIENHVIPTKTKIIILLSMWTVTISTACLAPQMRFTPDCLSATSLLLAATRRSLPLGPAGGPSSRGQLTGPRLRHGAAFQHTAGACASRSASVQSWGSWSQLVGRMSRGRPPRKLSCRAR